MYERHHTGLPPDHIYAPNEWWNKLKFASHPDTGGGYEVLAQRWQSLSASSESEATPRLETIRGMRVQRLRLWRHEL